MFHLSPRFWLDDELLTLVEPEAFELQPDPVPSDLLLVPAVDTDVLAYDIPRNAAPSAARHRRPHRGVEFVVHHPNDDGGTFRTFEDAASYAVESAATTQWRMTLDVRALNRAGARWWGGDRGLAAYDANPGGAALERFIVTAQSQGSIP